jgi:alkylhydroperoxidase/carboxymuconolactone decarboxylase family protein YurZ
MESSTDLGKASTDTYVSEYYTDAPTADSFTLLKEHGEHLLDAYVATRQVAFEGTVDQPGHLSRKDRELVILGMEIMARKNPPPVFHAQKAVESGATIEEIVDVIGLCIIIGGMITYQDAGQFVLREAVEHLARQGG